MKWNCLRQKRNCVICLGLGRRRKKREGKHSHVIKTNGRDTNRKDGGWRRERESKRQRIEYTHSKYRQCVVPTRSSLSRRIPNLCNLSRVEAESWNWWFEVELLNLVSNIGDFIHFTLLQFWLLFQLYLNCREFKISTTKSFHNFFNFI